VTLFRNTLQRWLGRSPDVVRLVGGPMDGWLVLPSAQCLRPDWYGTMPETLARRQAPGRYVRSGSVAAWTLR